MVLGEARKFGQRLGPESWAAFNWLLFLTGGESNRRAERQRVGERETERGAARRREEGRGGGRRWGQAGGGEGGARNEKLGVGGKQHSEAQVAELGEAPTARSPRGRRVREPGSARPRLLWAPASQRPPGGAGTAAGRGAAALQRLRAQERRRRDQTAGAERGERRRRAAPAPQPGLRQEARIFFKRLKLSFFPRVLGLSSGWNCSPDSRGALGRDSSPGFLRGSANFADPGTRGSRPLGGAQPALLPCSGGPESGLFASEDASPAPLDRAD